MEGCKAVAVLIWCPSHIYPPMPLVRDALSPAVDAQEAEMEVAVPVPLPEAHNPRPDSPEDNQGVSAPEDAPPASDPTGSASLCRVVGISSKFLNLEI